MVTPALCITRPGATDVRNVDVPQLAAHELLVEVKVCGVCRGDIDVFCGNSDVPLPSFGGHEGAGEVKAVGSDVKRFTVGDNVALLGDGRFRRYTVASEHQAVALPAAIDDWRDWIVEPLACCVNGIDVAQIRPDDVVAVIGCGFMGLGLVRSLALTPARQVIALDIAEDQLDRAKASGATNTVRADDANVLSAVDALVDRRPMPTAYLVPGAENGPIDVVFEASGTRAGLDLAISLARLGGTVVMFGHQQGTIPINGTRWHMKGLRVLNASPMIADDFHQVFYRTAMLMAAGRLTLAGLITHTGPLADATAIMERAGKPDYVKGALLIDA
jgi:L-iditol 2-dehydrogenase